MKILTTQHKGFTVVEMLIVIVVLGILATITSIAYGSIQEKGRQKKMDADIQTIVSAIKTARSNTAKNLITITGSNFTGYGCTIKTAGTDLATLPDSDECILRYKTNLQLIAAASGATLGDIRDPWGRPYYIDENEGESGGCSKDTVAAFARPLSGSNLYSTTPSGNVPLSGFSGCS